MPPPSTPDAPDGGPRAVALLLTGAFVLFNVWSFYQPDAFRELFEWRRDALRHGELWRLLTAHWLHLSPAHFAENLAGLAMLTWLADRWRLLKSALLLMPAFMLAIGLLLWLPFPPVQWYAGLSGALTALGAFLFLRRLNLPLGRLLFALLAGWLLLMLSMPRLHPFVAGTQAPVLQLAHLYGFLVGAAAAIATRPFGPPPSRGP